MEQISILLVYENKIIRECIRGMLDINVDISVIGEVENGLIMTNVCRKLKPDIILMDIDIPPLGGVQTTRYVNENFFRFQYNNIICKYR